MMYSYVSSMLDMTLTDLSIGEAAKTAVFGYMVDFGGIVILMIVLFCTGAFFK